MTGGRRPLPTMWFTRLLLLSLLAPSLSAIRVHGRSTHTHTLQLKQQQTLAQTQTSVVPILQLQLDGTHLTDVQQKREWRRRCKSKHADAGVHSWIAKSEGHVCEMNWLT